MYNDIMILNNSTFFIIGIKGAAMVHIAVILKKLGKNVTGCDVEEVFPTDTVLEQNHISYIPLSESQLPQGIQVVVYSASHGGKNNELVKQAQQSGVMVVHQAELIGELLKEFSTSLAVAGCHGKTTTSSLLAFALIQMQKAPSYLIGAPSFNGLPGGDYKDRAYFVIEADEYGTNPPEEKIPKFHYLFPDYALITNVDFDHPDVYESLNDTKKAFRQFVDNVLSRGKTRPLVVCSEDANAMDVVKELPEESYATYGFGAGATFRATDIRYSEDRTIFYIEYNNERLPFTIRLFGEKNVLNATGVIGLLLHMGFAARDIQNAISDFTGAKRRFELVHKATDTFLFDDYAHHPEEIEAVISAAKNRFPDRNIVFIFQPHTFSRTAALEDAFIEALSHASLAVLMPIFSSAREKATEQTITSAQMAEKAASIGKENVIAALGEYELDHILKEYLQRGDIVITAGAGDVYKLQNGIIEIINNLS